MRDGGPLGKERSGVDLNIDNSHAGVRLPDTELEHKRMTQEAQNPATREQEK